MYVFSINPPIPVYPLKLNELIDSKWSRVYTYEGASERSGKKPDRTADASDRRCGGKPAIKHIHERLVLEARRLLVHTPYSLKEIAFGLGFPDASYYTRFFKRETAVTPADYRASIRKMYQ